MNRYTPLWAIVLAPIAIYLFVLLWHAVLGPAYLKIRYSDTVALYKLDSEERDTRLQALKEIGSRAAADPPVIAALVRTAETDSSDRVRRAAVTAMGEISVHQALGGGGIDALSEIVLTSEDDRMLDVAIVAMGKSAAKNTYTDSVIDRIGRIFDEQHHTPVYSRAAHALGQLGAAQVLPPSVWIRLNTLFSKGTRKGDRANAAWAMAGIAKARRLPDASRELLADSFAGESNRRIRISIINALAGSYDGYPRAVELITQATRDADRDVAAAAQVALRGIEHQRTFGDREPLALATDATATVAARVKALSIIKSRQIDEAAFPAIVALARAEEIEVAQAAVSLFPHLARAPDNDFDRNVLIPEFVRAAATSEPRIREAAYRSISTIAVHRTPYVRAAPIPSLLEAGAGDALPIVRIYALAAMLRAARSRAEGDAVFERGMNDPDAEVRSKVVPWLFLKKTKTSKREVFAARGLEDAEASVRAATLTAQKKWQSRNRSWFTPLREYSAAGEYKQLFLAVFTFLTIAAPVVIAGSFLFYFAARLLTYLQQRRWRALALVPIIGVWVAACYAMFFVYFIAGHAGNLDGDEFTKLAAALWGAILVFTALGWGMHYAVRR